MLVSSAIPSVEPINVVDLARLEHAAAARTSWQDHNSTVAGARRTEAKMIERGQYRFTVKENVRGEFWLAAEPAGDTIKSLDNCVLDFHLEPKATHGHALAVADFLNRNIVAITLA
jgi:hypothetical protein